MVVGRTDTSTAHSPHTRNADEISLWLAIAGASPSVRWNSPGAPMRWKAGSASPVERRSPGYAVSSVAETESAFSQKTSPNIAAPQTAPTPRTRSPARRLRPKSSQATTPSTSGTPMVRLHGT